MVEMRIGTRGRLSKDRRDVAGGGSPRGVNRAG